MNKRKVVIVDDEHPALEVLIELVKRRPELEIALATTQFHDALDFLDENDNDILITDLDLRVDTGYRLMGAVEEPTQIIVCTAFEKEGTDAIGSGAIDFLTKMVAPERFDYAIDRALRKLELLENIARNTAYSATLFMSLAPDETSSMEEHRNPDTNSYKGICVSDLVYARSDGKNCRLFFIDGSQLLVRQLLRDVQTLLDPAKFIRIQRQYLVNKAAIGDYRPWLGDEAKHWWVVLTLDANKDWKNDQDNGRFPVGNKYRYRVEKALGIRK
ncbi:LytR/AlgR family response regulator transcription factor [Parapedobacter sp. 10938]|uniref:LytR/AlgR family response regulator transcription factor n=1 Tax=Parapedobacter flavus TaxID=3110225 RepID=UPI002DBBD1A1|nr:LytTR family DNA-binding domain-containing protein [Parapedobacter sp. 10938]MEC3879744.1 LytTR family DNA-binding domain-containing protein [Parapedobacter sp. 10938]